MHRYCFPLLMLLKNPVIVSTSFHGSVDMLELIRIDAYLYSHIPIISNEI